MCARSLALAVLLIPIGGCALLFDDDNGGGEGPQCDDVSGCTDDTSDFMEDPTCMLQGELELALGQGETEFSPLATGEIPELFYGFQGGQHIWMAVRVKNPDLERMQLQITVTAEYCDANCEAAESWAIDNVREFVADETTLRVTPEGWLEQTRMLVTVFGWVDAAEQRVEMVVTDPCGRQGIAGVSSFQ